VDVLVFGAGSLGSLIGGLLARRHDVTLVGREPHVGAVRESGLRIEGAVTARTDPTATTTVPNERFDLAVVTVKADDTAAAADALAGHADGRSGSDAGHADGRSGSDAGHADGRSGSDAGHAEAALSLQNGLGNEETLAAALSCPVLAGTCTYGARLAEPGRVECTGVGEVALGPRDGGASALASRVGAAFAESGIETTVAADMPRRLWKKLAVNAGINAPTALARVANGALVDGPASETAREAARETARVARAEGVDLGDDEAADAVASVAEATARNTSSMRQDIEAERRTEVDAITGAVAERGERAGVATPVTETLTALVRAWEREHGLRE